ncbi:MAG: DMT family transporter [Hyphomicrobiaceae bacterium]
MPPSNKRAASTTPGTGAGDDVRLGILLIALFSLTIPIIGSSVKILGQTLDIAQITWTRFLLQVILIGSTIAITSKAFSQPWPKPIWPLALRGAVITTGSALFYAALVILPLVEATAILFIQPLILTAMAALLLGERVGPLRWAAVVTGLIGAYIVIGPNFASIGWAALLPAGAAVCFAIASLITRVWAATAGAMMFQFITAATAIILLSVLIGLGTIGGIEELTLRWPSSSELALLLFAGCGSTITNLMLVQGFRIAPPSALAPFFYLEIVGATILGAIIFAQLPGLTTVLGTSIVIAAGLFVWWRETRDVRVALEKAAPHERQ